MHEIRKKDPFKTRWVLSVPDADTDWAYALGTDAYAEQMHQELNNAWLPQKLKKLTNILTPKSPTQKGFMV